MSKNALKTYYVPGTKEKKVMGEIIEDIYTGERFYETHRNRSQHEFHKLKGWGLDLKILDDLERWHVKKVIIVLDDEEIYLETTPFEFRAKGEIKKFPPFEAQYILPETRFFKGKWSNPGLGRYL